MANAYCTTTQAKIALGIAGEDHDSKLLELIEQVSVQFDREVGQQIAQVSRVEFYSGTSLLNGIPLNYLPSEDATDRGNIAVEESGTALVNGTTFMIDPYPARILFRTSAAETFTGSRWLAGERNIKVTYLDAWKMTPPDVELAATNEVERQFRSQGVKDFGDGSRAGVSSRSPAEGTSLSYNPDEMTPSTLNTLARIRDLLRVT